ncbi:uncharacterized protein KY384_003552 [Bacidia gigantensis]|uniref:uncharacterized protein n=1 Tax=Bacidia gigantensis TaxID=2732470 RepID=UPI001D0581EC|nr:uncharacterized protein KY384_003552 [Bacidia gigantensis]KAG8531916.1 hypothetical protein KY384_003552 [Bacidia gigantensis]
MNLDAFSPLAPARVRALVLPIGPVKTSRFSGFVRRLQRDNIVRLGDVSPDGRPNRSKPAMFSPLAFPDGLVYYDLSASFPSPPHLDLVPFEIYRLPLLIIGIIDGDELPLEQIGDPHGADEDTKENAELIDGLVEDLRQLREEYPLALTHQILIFDYAEKLKGLPEAVAIVPPVAKSRTTTIKTIMCDMTSNMLAEMAPYAKSLQDGNTIETPRAGPSTLSNGIVSSVPSHMHRTNRPMSVTGRPRSASPSTDAKQHYRMSMPAHMLSNPEFRASTPQSRSRSPPVRAQTPPSGGVNTNSATSLPRNSFDKSSRRSVDEREKTRGKARVGVVVGAMYLLAGRWPDATRELSNSVTKARLSSDYAWQAKALDYLVVCLLMCAFAGMDFRIPNVLRPSSEHLSTSSSKSSKHSPSNTIGGDSLPAQLSDDVLRYLVTGSGQLQPMLTLGYDGILPKPEIVGLLLKAYPGSASESSLTTPDRMIALAAISAVLSDLGQYRKMALILRDIVVTLLPSLIQARKDGAAEMGVHPATDLASLNATTSSSPSDSTHDSTDHGLQAFLDLTCRNFGILHLSERKEKTEHDNTTRDHSSRCDTTEAVAAILRQALLNTYGPSQLQVDMLRACINVCEALPDLPGVLKHTTMLLRITSSCVAPAPGSSNGSPNLAIEDQIRLSNNLARTLGAVQHLGLEDAEVDYWDDFLVRGIELAEANQAHQLTSHAKSEIDLVESIEVKKEKDPFIFNPFLKPKQTAKSLVLVAGEEAVFQVLLQNLFDFEVIIDEIVLISDIVPLHCRPQTVILGPYRTQTMLVPAIPLNRGTLTISGCRVKIRGCQDRTFSTFSAPWALQPDVKGRNMQILDPKHSSDPSKKHTQNSRSKSSWPYATPQATTLSLRVIDSQPLLICKASSLAQSAVVLQDGEVKSLSFTLSNVSHTATADLVLISFIDSVSTAMQEKLALKDLSAEALYELELSISQKSALRLHKSTDLGSLQVAPAEQMALQVEITGKPGLSSGIMQVDYCFLGTQKPDNDERFFTRQIKIPLTVTVAPSLELRGIDLVKLDEPLWPRSFSSSGVIEDQANHAPTLDSSHYNVPKVSSSLSQSTCLLLLDFHNLHSSTLTLDLQHHSPTNSTQGSPTTTTCHFHPNTTIRLPIRIPRIFLQNSKIHAAIPSLNPANQRQYVVSSTDASPQAEREAREGFWFRETLLKQLSATWKDEVTGRSGSIDLRQNFHVTPDMIAAYRLPEIEISMDIQLVPQPAFGGDDIEGSQQLSRLGSGLFEIPTQTFLNLSTTVKNRSETSIAPSILRLQPSLSNQPQETALDLAQKLFVNGLLQRSLPPIPAGGEVRQETGFVALVKGVYEWGASIEEISSDNGISRDVGSGGRKRAKTGDLDVSLGSESRRSWVAEMPCTIVTREHH